MDFRVLTPFRCCYINIVITLAYSDDPNGLYWLEQSFLKDLPYQVGQLKDSSKLEVQGRRSYCRLYRGVMIVRCFLQTTSIAPMLNSNKSRVALQRVGPRNSNTPPYHTDLHLPQEGLFKNHLRKGSL